MLNEEEKYKWKKQNFLSTIIYRDIKEVFQLSTSIY